MSVGGDRWKRSARSVAFLVGVVLLGAACLTVWKERETIREAWIAAGRGKWFFVAASVLLPCVNWLLTSVMFWALMPRPADAHRAVGFGEMVRLIGAAWLANYLPARPGFFGRLAYHKAVNDISIRGSLGAMLVAVALGLLAAGTALGIAVWFRWAPWTIVLPAIGGLLAATCCAGLPRRLLLAFSARYGDILVWMTRYAAVFALVGRPLSLSEAAAMAAISQLAMLVPFVGNGLGVREWAIRWAAPALPAWVVSAESLSGSLALSADVLNRAGEVVAAIPVGLACGVAVAGRVVSLTPRDEP